MIVAMSIVIPFFSFFFFLLLTNMTMMMKDGGVSETAPARPQQQFTSMPSSSSSSSSKPTKTSSSSSSTYYLSPHGGHIVFKVVPLPPSDGTGEAGPDTDNDPLTKELSGDDLSRYLDSLSTLLKRWYQSNPEYIPGLSARDFQAAKNKVTFLPTATIATLPEGYRLFGKSRTTGNHMDKYLYGHPKSDKTKFRR
jgi:hypothetical protein